MYIPKYFKVQELVTPELYAAKKDKAIEVMDEKILMSLDAIRSFLGCPIIVNNWHINGKRSLCGWRPKDCAIGAKNSSHKSGMAVDFICGLSATAVRKLILNNQWRFPLITRMEDNVSWVHIDCKFTGRKEIILFNP